MLGAFLWGRRANARCLRWEPTDDGGTVTGEHDGYQTVKGGVTHRRTLSLIGSRGEIRVIDELAGPGHHTADWYLHLAESCVLEGAAGQCFTFARGLSRITIEPDQRLSVEVLHGSQAPIAGWVSRGYHRKSAAYTLAGRCEWRDRLNLQTRITVSCGRRVPVSLALVGEEGEEQ